MSSPIASFYTARSTAFPIMIQWAFLDELGLAFKIERGNRVFPESDHSSDVIGALQREMKKLSVEVHLNTEVVQVCHKDGRFTGLRVKDTVTGSKSMVQGDALIIATGW